MSGNHGLINSSNSFRSFLSSPWIYFAVAYSWTWTFWIMASKMEVSLNSTLGVGMLMLGLFGPAIGGVGLTYLTQDKEGRRDYLKRIVDTRRISIVWFFVIFFSYPFISALSVLLDVITGGSGVIFGKAVEQLSILPAIVTLFFPAFLEELGWRGYALDLLQSRWSAFVSSLILGILWAFWHTPLFFFKASIQYNMGFGSLKFWTFIIGTVFVSIYLTWVFNNTNRSTLSAILWHAAANGTAAFITLTDRASNYSVALWFIAVIAIAWIWGTRTLTRQDAAIKSHYLKHYTK